MEAAAAETGDDTAPRSLLHEFDRLHRSSCKAQSTDDSLRLRLHRFHEFVRLAYELSPGGPPLHDLIDAIDTGTLHPATVAHLLYGLPFESWTAPPPDA